MLQIWLQKGRRISVQRVDLTLNRSLSSAYDDCGEWVSLGGETGQLRVNQALIQLNVPNICSIVRIPLESWASIVLYAI
jgi:hypothetical protein